jgi:acyl-CoA thioester hydrolase
MEKYSLPIQIRWADIDQNRHLLHSVYYDYGAMVRITFLSGMGLSAEKMEELKIGPIIFREEAIFRREINLEDEIEIDMELVKATSDFARWTIRHTITKKDGTVAAILNLDGAWIDIQKRKLTSPGEFIQKIFRAFPKSADFQMMTREATLEKGNGF